MRRIIRRYRVPLLALLVFSVLLVVNYDFGMRSLRTSAFGLLEMLSVLPPIFILLGLLDEWVPRETMVRYMGAESGVKGIVISFLLGSAAAGPLYGAFPVAAVFMRKGASLFNALIFIGAWSTTKIPMLLFEFSALGGRFALTRLLVDIIGIIIMARTIIAVLSPDEQRRIIDSLPG